MGGSRRNRMTRTLPPLSSRKVVVCVLHVPRVSTLMIHWLIVFRIDRLGPERRVDEGVDLPWVHGLRPEFATAGRCRCMCDRCRSRMCMCVYVRARRVFPIEVALALEASSA